MPLPSSWYDQHQHQRGAAGSLVDGLRTFQTPWRYLLLTFVLTYANGTRVADWEGNGGQLIN